MKKAFVLSALLVAFAIPARAQSVTVVDQPVQGSSIVTSDTFVENPTSSWRIAIQAGAAYNPGKVAESDAGLKEYYKGLKWGLNLGADVTYFLARNWGLGAKFSNAHFANSTTGTVYFDTGESRSGVLSDDVNTYFAGPIVSFRWLSSNNRLSFLTYYGIGYIGYHNKAMVVDPIEMKGATPGFALGFDFDLGITDRLFFGIEAGMVSGALRSYTATMYGVTQKVNLNSDEIMSASHIDLAAGLRLLF